MRTHLLAVASAVALVPAAAAQTAAEDQVLEVPFANVSAGISADLDGDRLILGQAQPVVASQVGAVQFWRREASGVWVPDGAVGPPTPVDLEFFGASVAIDGDRAVVGEPFDLAPGVADAGAAQVFERVAGVWTHVQTVRAPVPETDSRFGWSLDLDGDRLAVGADFEGAAGAVHLYERTAGTWQHVATLASADLAVGDAFGRSLDLEGDRVAIGAADEDDGGFGAGAVYAFERQANGTWLETAKLTASDAEPSDAFGTALDLDGERLIVCASGHDEPAATPGAAYVFERQTNGTWSEVDQLVVPVTPELGFAARAFDVALAGERAVVGYPGLVGGAFLFERRSDGTWLRSLRLDPAGLVPSTSASTNLGQAVELDGERLFVSAPAAGTGGLLGVSGQTFRYELGELYHGDPSVSLSAGGTHSLSLRAGDGAAGDVFLLVGTASGTTPGTVDPASGLLVPINVDAYTLYLLNTGGGLTAFVGALDGDGAAESALVVPPGTAPSLAGLTLHHAYLVVDTTTFAATLASNAVAVELTP